MRRLITGIDADGRSCIVDEAEVMTTAVDSASGLAMTTLHATDESPPPARPPGFAEWVDVRLAPGFVRWMVIDHAPAGDAGDENITRTMHHTDTLNLVLVQNGGIELLLQEGARELVPGDCVVMPGIDHAYRAGPDGCRLVVVQVGTPPPS